MPFADVVGDLLVQVVLQLGQLVGHRLGDALGEELASVESEQVLLDHAPHDAAGVGAASSCLALEPVTVEQREEELEVLLLARVRCRRHQQEVAGDVAEQLTELEALCLLQLAAEIVRAHPVRLVDDRPDPTRFPQLSLEFVVARQLVHSGDQQRLVSKT